MEGSGRRERSGHPDKNPAQIAQGKLDDLERIEEQKSQQERTWRIKNEEKAQGQQRIRAQQDTVRKEQE